MEQLQDKWAAVEATAEKLGVSHEAMRKWKERGIIPSRWHIPLITNSGGSLRLADFAKHEAAQ